MKYNLFLGGGGDIADSKDIDYEFFNCLKDGSQILYIPVAMDENVINYDSCADWFTKLLSSIENEKDIDFEMWREIDPVPQVDQYDAIYIGGGNTYYLRNILNETELSTQIVNYLHKGGIVYGGSAGAIIFGKSIGTVMEENDISSTDHSGYGLLGEWSVRCHYSDTSDDFFYELSSTLGPVIAIPETSGLAFNQNLMKVFGDPVYLYRNGIKEKITNEIKYE
jgi:dipeptidase E